MRSIYSYYCKQIYLATLVTAQKCLEMSFLLYKLHIVASDQIKEEKKQEKDFAFFL